jgi:hypothetical protein
MADQPFIVGEREVKENLLQGRKLLVLAFGDSRDCDIERHSIRAERIWCASEHVPWKIIEEE